MGSALSSAHLGDLALQTHKLHIVCSYSGRFSLSPRYLGDLRFQTRNVQTACSDSRVFHCHQGTLAILGLRPARSKPHVLIRACFALSSRYLGDLACQNHRLRSSSSAGSPRGVGFKETLATLGPSKIVDDIRDQQGSEGFKIPWRSRVDAAILAMQENIIATDFKVGDLLARSSSSKLTVQPPRPLM